MVVGYIIAGGFDKPCRISLNFANMKLLLLCSFIGLALCKVDYTGHKVYRAYPDVVQHKTIRYLGEQLNLDFWSEFRFEGDFVDFRVAPELQRSIETVLNHNQIKYEIFIEDLETLLEAQVKPKLNIGGGGSFEYNVYHTYDEINAWIDSFTSENSALASVVTIGTGKSYEGRNMRAVKISTGGSDKPAFAINCGLHAREWVTPATCMWVANNLVTKYNADSDITTWMNNVDFYLTPTANPDGYSYSWISDRMWRKTRTPAHGNGCKTNCDGVDPNRNWDDHWDVPGGSSTSCCNDAYRGPEPESEIEVVNQRKFVLAIPNVKAYIDVHAYSQYWMYPYGWTTANTPDESTLNTIAHASTEAITSVHGKRFTYGSIADVIYVATGSTADFFYDNGIKCSFAAELRDQGRYGFALPADQIIPTAEETFAGLMVIADNVMKGVC